ncbi:uncharacterized protein LOC106177248 [Lingula anatina]|uniref:Uncharacterized protein LOC106177248 n=1 Tax=Lingula anatina TaxID=7574 RepID=A0A1S3JZA4_LINAN|nr:uncharacterized protein LOC106177248 [Lingula anatina]|eukprot:XP_013415424.1 uncharacterized protein LOC106177248 [Lingula anatina]
MRFLEILMLLGGVGQLASALSLIPVPDWIGLLTTETPPLESPDGQVLSVTLPGGGSVKTGFSTRKDVSPDGKRYPSSKQLNSAQQQQSLAREPINSNTHPDNPEILPVSLSETGNRTKRQLYGQCRTWHNWVQPWWIYWNSGWWPVLNSPWWGWHWHYWIYCLPTSNICKSNYTWVNGRYVRFCSRCTTEWGWLRVPLWYTWHVRWVWIRAPVGCCCNFQRYFWQCW